MVGCFLPNTLPPEIFDEIFFHLDFISKIRLQRVNRAWYEFMNTNSWPWQYLHLSEESCPRNAADLDKYCARASYNCFELRLSGGSWDYIRDALERCQCLRHLWLGRSVQGLKALQLPQWPHTLTHLTVLRIMAVIQIEYALALMDMCPELETILFSQLSVNHGRSPHLITEKLSPKVKDLRMTTTGSTIHLPDDYFLNARSLEYLRIVQAEFGLNTNFDSLLQLQRLTMRRCYNLHHLPPLSNLVFLRLKFSDESWRNLTNVTPMPKLKVLIVEVDYDEAVFVFLNHLIQQIGIELETLTINPVNWSPILNTATETWIESTFELRQMKHLKRLTLDHTTGLTNHSLRVISQGSPELEHVRFYEARSINCEGVQEFVQALPCLKSLDLTECPEIEVSTLSWIEERGISVSWD